MALFALSNSLGFRLKENYNAFFPHTVSPRFPQDKQQERTSVWDWPLNPCGYKTNSVRNKGSWELAVTPFSFTRGEIQGETHTLRTGGAERGHERVDRKQQQRAGRTKALPWSVQHDRQPAQGKTHCSVCAALLAGLRNQTLNPRAFWDTVSLYIAQAGLKFWTFLPQLPNITCIHHHTCI